MVEPDRRRLDECGPVLHGALAKGVLHHGFGNRQILAGIHAEELLFLTLDHGGGQAFRRGMGDRVGQVVFALGVVGVELIEQPLQMPAVERRHDTGVAEIDLKLFGVASRASTMAVRAPLSSVIRRPY